MEQVLATLGINGWNFLLHTINFLVLIFLLSRILYKPIVGMLDDRQRRIRDSIERAEQVRLEAERASQEREAQLGETRRQIQEMLAQATQMAERIQSEARQDAQRQADQIVARARQEAEAERAQSLAELRREVASLAVLAAERVISRNLDDSTQRQLVDEFLAERATADGRT
jgi:F-type H+-transporting ATPase subunit b